MFRVYVNVVTKGMKSITPTLALPPQGGGNLVTGDGRVRGRVGVGGEGQPG